MPRPGRRSIEGGAGGRGLGLSFQRHPVTMSPPRAGRGGMGKPKKPQREKDLTARFLTGDLDEDRLESQQRFTARNKGATQQKILKTALLRADEQARSEE